MQSPPQAIFRDVPYQKKYNATKLTPYNAWGVNMNARTGWNKFPIAAAPVHGAVFLTLPVFPISSSLTDRSTCSNIKLSSLRDTDFYFLWNNKGSFKTHIKCRGEYLYIIFNCQGQKVWLNRILVWFVCISKLKAIISQKSFYKFTFAMNMLRVIEG